MSLCIPHPTVKGVMKYSLTLAYSITNENCILNQHTDSKWLTGKKKASKIKSFGNHIWFYIWHEALKDNWRMTSRKEEMHPHLYNSSSSISNICLMPKGKNQTQTKEMNPIVQSAKVFWSVGHPYWGGCPACWLVMHGQSPTASLAFREKSLFSHHSVCFYCSTPWEWKSPFKCENNLTHLTNSSLWLLTIILSVSHRSLNCNQSY